MGDETDKEMLAMRLADRDKNRELFKWAVMLLIGLAQPLITWYLHRDTRAIVDTAATTLGSKVAAVQTEVKEADKTALKTNVAVNEWKASYTNSPSDLLHAEESRTKLEQHGETPAALPQSKQP